MALCIQAITIELARRSRRRVSSFSDPAVWTLPGWFDPTSLAGAGLCTLCAPGFFFKHEAYNNEQEYRFFQIHRFDWRSLAAGALKEIVIWPAADRDKAFQFVTDCLRSFHRDVPVIVEIGGAALLALSL
jgi:hypothetical protein